MIDEYTTSDMNLDGEVKYPSNIKFELDKDNLRAFTTHN